MEFQQPLNEQQYSVEWVAYVTLSSEYIKKPIYIVEGKEHHALLRGFQK